MQDKYGDLWQRYTKANREGNDEEASRIAKELLKEGALSEDDMRKVEEKLGRQMEEARKKVLEGKQRPNLARCVEAAMQELKTIGLWDGEYNTTYDIASATLAAYAKAEKGRVKYLAAMKAWRRVFHDYITLEVGLAYNLVFKMLSPLEEKTSRNPLDWFFNSEEIIELCKNNGVKLSISSLRGYQKIGLIPKPIRLGRKAKYSILTVLRILMIHFGTERGEKLKDIKKIIDPMLRHRLGEWSDIYSDDTNWFHDACGSITFLSKPSYETLLKAMKERK